MKTSLTTLILLLTFAFVTAQTSDKVASTPALNHDWRVGFINITELNGGLGLADIDTDFSRQYFGITTVNGYQFSRNIKAGIGVGIQLHNGGALLPLYLDVRYSLNAQEIVPFIAAAGGFALTLNDMADKSRIFINPSIGVKWVAGTRTGLSLSTGLMMMSGDYYRSSFLNFKFGVELKSRQK